MILPNMNRADMMVVVSCPRCGSTDAGEGDSSRAPPTLFVMACGHCKWTSFVDDYEIKYDWNQHVPNGPLPRFVPPYERLEAAVRKLRTGPGNRDPDAYDPDARAISFRATMAWGEPHRAYHTAQHLAECLALLDDSALTPVIRRPSEVELALWLHDLVYDPTRSDNEEKSAAEARVLLTCAGGIAPDAIDRVAAMILATKDHVSLATDQSVLLDIDLSILAAPPERFAEYEDQIRQEYAFVPDEAYRAGRRAVLARFAVRPRLYLTDVLHDRFDARARANLERALLA